MNAWRTSACAALAAAAWAGSALAAPRGAGGKAAVQRGRYLVTVGGCNDCHTPLEMGPNGPVPDMTRLLSGHPEGAAMPAAPGLPPGPWGVVVAADLTAWSGPWGTSFSANLTPDRETGLGRWTERNFIETMRTGRHMGLGRPILPPMPYRNYGRMTDADLEAVFAYLRSIPPLRNRVPAPMPPPAAAGGTAPPAAR